MHRRVCRNLTCNPSRDNPGPVASARYTEGVALKDPGADESGGAVSIAELVGRARLDPPEGEEPVLETGHLSQLVEGSEGPVARVAALGRTAQTAFRLGRASDCLAALDRQREAAGNDTPALVWALTSSAACRSIFAQLDRARADLTDVRRLCHHAAPLLAEPFWRFAEAVCNWLEGDWAAAHAGATRLDEAQASLFSPAIAGIVIALRVELLRGLGRAHECGPLVERLTAGAPAEISAWALAGLDADDGRPGDALRRLADVCDAGARSVYRTALPLVLHRMAEIAFWQGDQDVTSFAAGALAGLDQAAPLTEILAGLAQAYASRDPEPAVRAQEAAEALGAGLLAAEALTVAGQVGDRAALSAAHAAWSRIGAPGKARAVAAAMSAAGLPVPIAHYRAGQAPPADPDALTARERALCRLVHEGRTNQQIARALHISVKTVEAYLTRVYRKTKCSSRVELAVAVTEHRIQVDE
jgi:DNA-binding NarL/FixJ family response regulator